MRRYARRCRRAAYWPAVTCLDSLRRHRHRQGPARLQRLGDQERELKRLLRVQPRVAESLIPAAEIGLREPVRAADALGDVLAGHLDMDAAAPGPGLGVAVEETVHLAQDRVEAAGLDLGGRADRVPVHRVAQPNHLEP